MSTITESPSTNRTMRITAHRLRIGQFADMMRISRTELIKLIVSSTKLGHSTADRLVYSRDYGHQTHVEVANILVDAINTHPQFKELRKVLARSPYSIDTLDVSNIEWPNGLTDAGCEPLHGAPHTNSIRIVPFDRLAPNEKICPGCGSLFVGECIVC